MPDAREAEMDIGYDFMEKREPGQQVGIQEGALRSRKNLLAYETHFRPLLALHLIHFCIYLNIKNLEERRFATISEKRSKNPEFETIW